MVDFTWHATLALVLECYVYNMQKYRMQNQDTMSTCTAFTSSLIIRGAK
jgi:hypothetical protein